MGYFDNFAENVKRDYVVDGWKDIKEIYTVDQFNLLRQDLFNIIGYNPEELLKTISTIYDFNKKEMMDKFGITFSNKIDITSKELLARKLSEDLINLAHDYYRTFGQMINLNMNMTFEDLLKNLDKLKTDVPLVNKYGKSTKNFADRIRDIVRTNETVIKAQAIFNTGLQLGLSKYNIITARDSRVCLLCKEIEYNNPYEVTSGVLPAFHVDCRCIIEFINEKFTNNTFDIDKFYDIWTKVWIQV